MVNFSPRPYLAPGCFPEAFEVCVCVCGGGVLGNLTNDILEVESRLDNFAYTILMAVAKSMSLVLWPVFNSPDHMLYINLLITYCTRFPCIP